VRQDYPEEFLQLLRSVKNKRARLVIDHILEHGFVTTEEISALYGYSHPPRAARDVREEGILLDSTRIRSSTGRWIASYSFAASGGTAGVRSGGRKAFPEKLKQMLFQQSGHRCAVCLTQYEGRYLQIDHRIPYAVGGDPVDGSHDPADYTLLCGSCNRAKSWSCEHCPNWLEFKEAALCLTCYWANPSNYKHIALKIQRRIDVTWSEQEAEHYERLKAQAETSQESIPDYVKAILRQHTEQS